MLDGQKYIDYEEEDSAAMARAYKVTWIWSLSVSVLIFVVWPLLTLPAGIFSEGYFTFWVVLSMAWGTVACVIVVLYPLIESADTLKNVLLCRPYVETEEPSVTGVKEASKSAKDVFIGEETIVDARN